MSREDAKEILDISKGCALLSVGCMVVAIVGGAILGVGVAAVVFVSRAIVGQ